MCGCKHTGVFVSIPLCMDVSMRVSMCRKGILLLRCEFKITDTEIEIEGERQQE